jgi:Uma2 family endonuclease
MDIRPLNYDVPKDTTVDEDGRVRLTNAFMERLSKTDLLPPSARWELLNGVIYNLRYERYRGHPELKLDIREDEDGRVRFTNRAMAQLVEAGLIDADERWELLRGEWFDVPSEGEVHFFMRAMLLRVFVRSLPDEWLVNTKGSIFLADSLEIRPDLSVQPIARLSNVLRGQDLLLAIEVVVTSHRRDLNWKLPIYAEAGVPEVWMIDAETDRVHVYHRPQNGAYQQHAEYGPDQPVTPVAFPEISVRLADLKP